MNLTNEVRKFTDDDFRAAVAVLNCCSFDLDHAIRCLEICSTSHSALNGMLGLCENLENDYEAAKQLLIVTDSFRALLGMKPGMDDTSRITADDQQRMESPGVDPGGTMPIGFDEEF